MSPLGFIVIIAMVVYAIYRQTQRHEIVGSTRFKVALIYAVVGLVIGGFNFPQYVAAAALLAVSLLLSVVVGLVRDRYTRVWRDGADQRLLWSGHCRDHRTVPRSCDSQVCAWRAGLLPRCQ